MAELQEIAKETMRGICSDCKPRHANSCLGEARQFNKFQSEALRYGVLESTETLDRLSPTIFTGILDGITWETQQFGDIRVKSRSNGQYTIGTCGFDPEFTFKIKRKSKKAHVELLYIHLSFCNKDFIGTEFHGGGPGTNNSTNSLQFIDANRSLSANTENYDVFEWLAIEKVFPAMARAIDGNLVFGDFTGDFRGELTKEFVQGRSKGLSQYSAIDGWLKQAWQHAGSVQQPCTVVHVPETLEEGQCYWIEIDDAAIGGQGGGNIDAFETPQEVVEYLNTFCTNVTQKYPYTASLTEDGDIKIIGSVAHQCIYGTGLLHIYVAESINACTDALPHTVVVPDSIRTETAKFCDFWEFQAAPSKKDYFAEKVCWISDMCAELDSGETIDSSDLIVAIDPLCMNQMDKEDLTACETCNNWEERNALRQRLQPTYVPLRIMHGSKIWFATTRGNLVVLTNVNDPRLGETNQWFDPECQTINMRKEMVLGAAIADEGKFFSNIKNSGFVAKLHPPQEPIIKDCPTECDRPIQDRFKVRACVTKTCNPDGTASLLIEDNSVCPTGVGITEVNVTIYQLDGSKIVVAPLTEVGSVNATVPLTEEQCKALTYVNYAVTTTEGEIKETNVLYDDIQKIDCPERGHEVTKGKSIVAADEVTEEDPKTFTLTDVPAEGLTSVVVDGAVVEVKNTAELQTALLANESVDSVEILDNVITVKGKIEAISVVAGETTIVGEEK